jgi:periplasmic protein TonB
LIVNATGKPGTNAQASNPKPSAAQPQAQTQTPAQAEQAPAPVSPDAMAAQLVAPTRIAGQIKKTAVADEPPPTAPSTVSLDDNNSVPGSVFGSGSKARVMPHVVAISAGVASGMILHKTAPVYPKFAQDAHITGTVVLKATITKQGTIEGIQVLSGPKLLAPSAVDAVKTWKYKPYMLDGQPVSVETNVTVVFGGRQ